MSKHNHHHDDDENGDDDNGDDENNNDDNNQSGDSGGGSSKEDDDDNSDNTFQPTNVPSPLPTQSPTTLPPTLITTVTTSTTISPTAFPTMESTTMSTSTSLSAVVSQVPVIVEMGNAGPDNVGMTVMHLWPWFIVFGIFCCLGLCACYLRRVMNREKEFSMISTKTKGTSDMEHETLHREHAQYGRAKHVAFASVSTVDERGSDSETEYESEYIDGMAVDVVVHSTDSRDSRDSRSPHNTPRRTVYREEDPDEDVDEIQTGVSLEIGGKLSSKFGGKQIAFPMSADVDDIVLDHDQHDDDDGNGFITSTKGKGKCMRKNGIRFQPILGQKRSEGQLGNDGDTLREGDFRIGH